jgi:DNA-binding transcriptional LysR family regulator
MQKDEADNLADLHLLVQVVDAGGLAAAAEKLGTTRSLVSRRLLALEARLGARLLHRNARELGVTGTGEEVYRHAVLMCEAAQAALLAAREGKAGRVSVGAHALLRPLLDELIAAWGAAHPHDRLAACVADSHADALVRERLDALLDVGVATQAPGLSSQPLGSMRLVVVGSPALLERLGQPVRPELVEDACWLAFAGAPWNLRGVAPRKLQPRLSSDHLPTLLAAVRAGVGLVQLPMYTCHDDLAAGRLQMVFEAFEARPLPWHALTPKVTAAHGFLAFTREYLAGQRERGLLADASL